MRSRSPPRSSARARAPSPRWSPWAAPRSGRARAAGLTVAAILVAHDATRFVIRTSHEQRSAARSARIGVRSTGPRTPGPSRRRRARRRRPPAGPVPLDQRIDHAEQESADQFGGDVVAHGPLAPPRPREVGQPVVDGRGAARGRRARSRCCRAPAAAGSRPGRCSARIATDARAARPEAGRARTRRGRSLAASIAAAQRVQRLVEGRGEQVLLARHVVVDRRFRQSELTGQVAHAGAVVPLPDEQVDRRRSTVAWS